MAKTEVLAVIENEPQRVEYGEEQSSRGRSFRKILIDGEDSGYAKCLHIACEDKITIYKNNVNSASEHHHRWHIRGKIGRKSKEFVPRPRFEVNELLQKAAENVPEFTRNSRFQEIWSHFAPTGRFSSDTSRLVYECCYCNFECAKNVTIYKEHIIEHCPSVPSEFRELMKNRNLGLDTSYLRSDDGNPKVKKERRRKSRDLKDEGKGSNDDSTDVSGPEEDVDQKFDVDDSCHSELQSRHCKSRSSSKKFKVQPAGYDDELDSNEEVVEILAKLLRQQNDEASSPPEPVHQFEPVETSKYSDTDLERKIKELKLQKLMKQVEEANLALKERETSIKEKEIAIREKEERIALYHYLQHKINKCVPAKSSNGNNGVDGKSFIEDALDTVMNGNCN